jgi:hypothetical protein
MVKRLVTSAWLLTEKHFRKVMGHEHLWIFGVNPGREESPRAADQVAQYELIRRLSLQLWLDILRVGPHCRQQRPGFEKRSDGLRSMPARGVFAGPADYLPPRTTTG